MSEPTALSAAQQALAQNARFLARCTRLAGVGAWEWQEHSGQLTLSESACELLGLPPDRVPTLPELLARFGVQVRRANGCRGKGGVFCVGHACPVLLAGISRRIADPPV